LLAGFQKGASKQFVTDHIILGGELVTNRKLLKFKLYVSKELN